MKVLLVLWFFILCSCSPGGSNVQQTESLMQKAFSEAGCSQEVIQSYQNAVNKLKQKYSKEKIVQKINNIIETVKKIGCR